MITISGHGCSRFVSSIQLCFVCIRRYKIFPLCAHPYISKLKRFRNSLRVFIFTIGLERWKQKAKKRRQTQEQNSTVCFPRQLCFCLLSVALHFFTWNSKFKNIIDWYRSQQHFVTRWRRKSFRKYNRITKDGKWIKAATQKVLGTRHKVRWSVSNSGGRTPLSRLLTTERAVR